AFVEIKPASIAQFGAEIVAERVIDALLPIRERAVIISFDAPLLERVRPRASAGIGWILSVWHEEARRRAEALAPDFLFCDHRLLPPLPETLWSGGWRWAIYDAPEADLALELARRGAHFVETMAIAELLEHPELRAAHRHHT
ncbi:MAG: PI-PLC domain-containing protein, partial [Planctomycetota bacterium]